MVREIAPASLTVPLVSRRELSWGRDRCGEPVTIGIPLPAGAARTAAEIGLLAGGMAVPVQVCALDYWPDRSIRWALVSFPATARAGAVDYALTIGQATSCTPESVLRIDERTGQAGVEVAADHVTFRFVPGGPFPMSVVTGGGPAGGHAARCAFQLEHGGRRLDVHISDVSIHERGPLRTEIAVEGRLTGRHDLPLFVSARVEIFAGTAAARVDLTVRNTRRAKHPSGQWSLGDPGSVLLQAATLIIDTGSPIERVRCAPEWGDPLETVALPFEIYQDSSGGDRWNDPVHRNRDGRVPLQFRGYRLISGDSSREGGRASPVVVAEGAGRRILVAVPDFWENFPRAIRAEDATIEVGLFPRQHGDQHELQGGEQKTHRVFLAFGKDAISDPPLAWTHDPLLLYPSSEWVCASGVVPYLTPPIEARGSPFEPLVTDAFDLVNGLFAKREQADEYGWRHFGDLYADHESAFQPPDRPFVSHYNNQYDAIAAFAVHFLRSGDPRWWRLMSDLARHVRDVDIYHTSEDKAAYNGGLFWHTAHYVDAGLSTHRTYPPGCGSGGGPSAEHNYNIGLMLHYFLTGDWASREAAVGLGAWVVRMDDGRTTPFRWLASGPTGLASLTRDYHGPGRGAGHSILACLVAERLTGDPVYRTKAETLIARCIHPRDSIDARQLLDAERRWSYTVFLQALGMYLHDKGERSEFDELYAHARASLLHYARWMLVNERPYLEHADTLEYPTETWVAQELRKADVFLWAALHAAEPDRKQYLDRARYFFEYATRTLAGMTQRRFTRPLVLVLGQGVRYAWFDQHRDRLPVPVLSEPPPSVDPPTPFVPQKRSAMRRLTGLGILGVLLACVLLVVLFSR